ncbi:MULTISPECIES: RNA-binding protein [unclassified Emticicia]|uniref:RNA recognition motif domain-containing protein n=1 Tax=unclassified Emticicia TaxID=2627301 RepID=UPI000C761672|nr:MULTISPECIES: RNA-binding protein [unclassified Emticicia]PLK43368.1 RNA-binding protein [Emticicia sp. TH156]UTA68897.1 RNA-binding protein [Emticicia sp. 21SJ11W-3]
MDIFVGSIPFKLKEKELRALFEKYGEVTSVKIVKDKATRQNKGFGFVDMPDEDAVRNAIHELNGTELMGRVIEVGLSAKKEVPKPVKNFKINHLGKATTERSFRGIGKGYDKRNKK